MNKVEGILQEVHDVLHSKLQLGDNSYKPFKEKSKYISSLSTYKTYIKHGCYFATWAKEKHNCKTLDSARIFINEYLQMRIEQGVSPYTQKLEACALAKLYGCGSEDFLRTQPRKRSEIILSRGEKAVDKYFSEWNNRPFIEFCRSTGLKRFELETLTSQQLLFNTETGTYYLKIVGKNGRYRESPIISDDAVEIIKNSEGLVWKKISKRADIQSYRADYCSRIYKQNARPLSEIPKKERYYAKGDLKGNIFDRRAMEIVRDALGFNSIKTIVESYCWNFLGNK